MFPPAANRATQGSWNSSHQGQGQFGDYFPPVHAASSQPPEPSGEMGYFPPVSITNEILRNGSTGSSSDGNVKSRGQDGDEHDEEGENSSPVSTFTGTGTGTGRDGSESSGIRVTSPDVI